MGQNVKNTIGTYVANLISPHYCCSCGEIGDILCEYCKFNIIDDAFMKCLQCNRPTGEGALCKQCALPYKRAWCGGERSGALESLIDHYKFNRGQSSCMKLAEILDETLPILPVETVLVPIPTILPHVRVRGYDHCLLLAKRLGKLRGLHCEQHLIRCKNETQRGASRHIRQQQAARAFACHHQLSATIPYLIVDDIYTTGATVIYAAKALRAAGARNIWVAVVARQPFKE